MPDHTAGGVHVWGSCCAEKWGLRLSTYRLELARMKREPQPKKEVLMWSWLRCHSREADGLRPARCSPDGDRQKFGGTKKHKTNAQLSPFDRLRLGRIKRGTRPRRNLGRNASLLPCTRLPLTV